MNTTTFGKKWSRRMVSRKMYKPYSAEKVREQQLQDIYEVVLNEVNNTLLDRQYATWDDFNVEVAIVWRNQWYVVVIWGESGEALTEWYSIAIRPDGKEDEPGEIEGFYTKGGSPEEIKKALKRAFAALDRYIDTGTIKVPPKKKYRKGGHILSLDELNRQDFVYWHDKITHRGWFRSWQFRMAAECIGEKGCIFYAIAEEVEK